MLDTVIRTRPGKVAAICVVRKRAKPGEPTGFMNPIRRYARYWRTGGFFMATTDFFAYAWADRLSQKLGTTGPWQTAKRKWA